MEAIAKQGNKSSN